VRWYITYRLSYRDLVAMMAERGISVSHTTIHRWVIRYVPEFEKRWNRFARPVNMSWRVDETYIKVRGKWLSAPPKGTVALWALGIRGGMRT
jgi:transposase-like protein